MKRLIPVECFRKKVIRFEIFPFSRFYRCAVPLGVKFSQDFSVKCFEQLAIGPGKICAQCRERVVLPISGLMDGVTFL